MSFSLIPIQNVQSMKDQYLESKKRWYKNNDNFGDREEYLESLLLSTNKDLKTVLSMLTEDMLISRIPDVLLIRCILRHFTQSLPEIIPMLLNEEEKIKLLNILHDLYPFYCVKKDVPTHSASSTIGTGLNSNSELDDSPKTEELTSFSTELDIKPEPCEIRIAEDKENECPDQVSLDSNIPVVTFPTAELEAVIKPKEEPKNRSEDLVIDSAYSLSAELHHATVQSSRLQDTRKKSESHAIGVDIFKISPRKNTQGLVSSLPKDTSLKLVDLKTLLKDSELKPSKHKSDSFQTVSTVSMDGRQIMNRYLPKEFGRMKERHKQIGKLTSSSVTKESDSTEKSTSENEGSDMEIIDSDFRKTAENLPTRHTMVRPTRRAANLAAKRTKKVVIESRMSSSSSEQSSSEDSDSEDSELDKINSDVDTVKEQEVTSRMKRQMQEKRRKKRKIIEERNKKNVERKGINYDILKVKEVRVNMRKLNRTKNECLEKPRKQSINSKKNSPKLKNPAEKSPIQVMNQNHGKGGRKLLLSKDVFMSTSESEDQSDQK